MSIIWHTKIPIIKVNFIQVELIIFKFMQTLITITWQMNFSF